MPTPSVKMGLSLPSQPDDFSTADLRSNWEKIDAAPGVHICTAATRPAWGSAQIGRTISENDTGVQRRWTGSLWHPLGWEPGDIKTSARLTPSEGWLIANGALLNRPDQPALFAAIGTQYNIGGETSTQFRLPNPKGKTVVALDAANAAFDVLGETGGTVTTVITEANLPPHAHSMAHNHDMSHTHNTATTGIQSAYHSHSGYASNAGEHYHDNKTETISGGANVLDNDHVSRYGSSTTGYKNIATSLSGIHAHTVVLNDENANHTHNVDVPSFNGATGGSSTGSTSNGNGTAAAMSNLSPYIVFNVFIKT